MGGSNDEVDWDFTNSAKLPLRLRCDDALVTFRGGSARVFARLQIPINRARESAGNLSMFSN